MYKREKLYGKMDIPAYLENYVNVADFLAYGKASPRDGEKWSYPEAGFDVLAYWNQYPYIHIIGNKIIFDEATLGVERTPEEVKKFMADILAVEKQKLAEILYEAEARYPGSVSLSAGSCHLCAGCEKLAGRPCKYPEKIRYSMESLGANVGKTCSKLLRVELLWTEENKVPQYFVLISALLSKEEFAIF